MSVGSKRVAFRAIVIAIAVAAVCAVPVLAWAVAGDNIENPVTLAVPSHNEGALIPVPSEGDAELWYIVHLTTGQTLSATMTLPPTSDAFAYAFSADHEDALSPYSDPIAPGLEHLTLQAPRTGDFFVALTGSTASTFSIDATIAPAVTFSLNTLSVPKAKAKKTFTTSVKISPSYNGTTVPIRFYVSKKTHGKWKALTWKTGSLPAGALANDKFFAKFKFGKGTYKIRARFKDAAHASAKYTAWKTLKIKK